MSLDVRPKEPVTLLRKGDNFEHKLEVIKFAPEAVPA